MRNWFKRDSSMSWSPGRLGFERITLLLGLAVIAVVSVALVLRLPIKAQAKSIQTSSNLNALVQYLTPPTITTPIAWEPDELSAMPVAILLRAGTSIELGIVPNAAGVQSGGIWQADAGTITSTGIYTAPAFLPETGVDTITYINANGSYERFYIRIVPNPSIANSNKTPIIRVANVIRQTSATPSSGSNVPQTLTTQVTVTEDPLPTVNDASTLISQGVVPLGPGESLAPVEEYTQPQNLPTETAGNTTFYRMPCIGYPAQFAPIGARFQSGQPALQAVKLVPQATNAVIFNRQATDAQRATDCVIEEPLTADQGKCGCSPEGKIQYKTLAEESPILLGPPTTLSLGSITITVAHKNTISAAIPGLGTVGGETGPTVGTTYNIQAKDFTYKQLQKRHVYKCISGKMKYIRTEKRLRTGTTREYIPRWIWPIWGGPAPKEFLWGPWTAWGP